MTQSADALQHFIRDLRQAREYQHVPLERVAEETRISLDYLQALETGDWGRIPAAFLRGYLTAYAETVGMVRDKVLKRFDELGYQSPPAKPRDPQLEIPAALTHSPSTRRSAAEQAPGHLDSSPSAKGPSAGSMDPVKAKTRVPSLWDVIPTHVKAGGALLTLVLITALVLGAGALISRMLGGNVSDPDTEQETLEQVDASSPTTLQGFTPFKIRLRQSRVGTVRVSNSERVHFNGLLPVDSTLSLSSSTELTIQVQHLEALRVWRDERPLDLPAEPGAAELILARGAENIIRRMP